jgi:hypothetical protein
MEISVFLFNYGGMKSIIDSVAPAPTGPDPYFAKNENINFYQSYVMIFITITVINIFL